MLVREFTYKDYNGIERKETWCFNLTRADLLERELGAFGGLDELLKRLVREERPKEIVAMFKELILSSVGRKSPDGRRFERTQAIQDDFYQTEAYSQLFVELVTDATKMRQFLLAVVDDEVRAAMLKAEEEQSKETPAELKVLPGGDVNADH